MSWIYTPQQQWQIKVSRDSYEKCTTPGGDWHPGCGGVDPTYDTFLLNLTRVDIFDPQNSSNDSSFGHIGKRIGPSFSVMASWFRL